jgi:hypothetical protein
MFGIYGQLFQIYDRSYGDPDSLRLNPFFIELLFWLLVIALTVLFLKWRPRWMDRLEASITAFSRRKTAIVIGAGVLVVLLRVAILPWNPEPVPIVHDEFSYLLQAKTFNDGRITNPSHPLAMHFESFHINMWPTYQSMYPVGQASFLLAGQVLLGDPWFGVLLSMGLMCSAIVWMLQGWMPPQWALLGGIFTILRFGLFGPWINSYWGGAVAAIGGALLFGAMARLRHSPHVVRYALVFTLGLAILANTRPFEGFVFSLLPLAWMAHWLFRRFRTDPRQAFQALACGLVILVPMFSGILYYNYRSTGSPLVLPYAINHKTYHISKPFIWQERYPLHEYNHLMMKKFYIFHELPDYLNSRQPGGIAKLTRLKIRIYYEFFIWPLGIAFVPAAWFAAKSRRWRLPFLATMAVFIALLVQMWPPHGHYAAPATCVVVALLLLMFRLARTIRFRGLDLGVALSRALATAVFLVGLGWGLGSYLNMEELHQYVVRIPPQIERARLIQKLEQMPGKHLVIVRSDYFSWPGFDWIYNEADIDSAKIVWARDVGDQLNRELISYFKDHTVWEINVDQRILRAYQSIPLTEEESVATLSPPQTAKLQPQSETAPGKKVHAK